MVRSLLSGVRRWGQRIEEKTMSERDYLVKEEALRRRSEPKGDHELHAALERMREATPTTGGSSTACTSRATPTAPS